MGLKIAAREHSSDTLSEKHSHNIGFHPLPTNHQCPVASIISQKSEVHVAISVKLKWTAVVSPKQETSLLDFLTV
jgi:hypothetical protein